MYVAYKNAVSSSIATATSSAPPPPPPPPPHAPAVAAALADEAAVVLTAVPTSTSISTSTGDPNKFISSVHTHTHTRKRHDTYGAHGVHDIYGNNGLYGVRTAPNHTPVPYQIHLEDKRLNKQGERKRGDLERERERWMVDDTARSKVRSHPFGMGRFVKRAVKQTKGNQESMENQEGMENQEKMENQECMENQESMEGMGFSHVQDSNSTSTLADGSQGSQGVLVPNRVKSYCENRGKTSEVADHAMCSSVAWIIDNDTKSIPFYSLTAREPDSQYVTSICSFKCGEGEGEGEGEQSLTQLNAVPEDKINCGN